MLFILSPPKRLAEQNYDIRTQELQAVKCRSKKNTGWKVLRFLFVCERPTRSSSTSEQLNIATYVRLIKLCAGHFIILTIVDQSSKMAHFVPPKKFHTEKETAEQLLLFAHLCKPAMHSNTLTAK